MKTNIVKSRKFSSDTTQTPHAQTHPHPTMARATLASIQLVRGACPSVYGMRPPVGSTNVVSLRTENYLAGMR